MEYHYQHKASKLTNMQLEMWVLLCNAILKAASKLAGLSSDEERKRMEIVLLEKREEVFTLCPTVFRYSCQQCGRHIKKVRHHSFSQPISDSRRTRKHLKEYATVIRISTSSSLQSSKHRINLISLTQVQHLWNNNNYNKEFCMRN